MGLFDRLRARRAPVPPEPPPVALANFAAIAASRVRAGLARMPKDRLSRDEGGLAGLLARYDAQFAGFPNDDAGRLRRVLRYLCQYDEDLAGAKRDLVVLANAGHELEITGGARAVNQAATELEAFSQRVFPEGGGLDGLVNNQLGELYQAGASSLEWYPEPGRKGVAGVAVIPAEQVRHARDPVTNAWRHWQTGVGPGGEIELHPLTYNHAALQTDGSNPTGIPLVLSALDSVDRKRKLLDGETRVLALMGRAALVKASVPKPTPAELGLTSERDPTYASALGAYYAEVADLIVSSSEHGLYVGPAGVEIDVVGLTQGAAGLKDITLSNQRRVWTASRSLPFMRGHMDSTTEALAKVVYPILEAEAGNLQLVIGQQLAFGLNLHLRLRGIPASVFVHWTQADSPFALEKAQTELARAETDEILKRVLGRAWAPHAARRWGVDLEKDPLLAPDGWDAQPTPDAYRPPAPPARARLALTGGRYAMTERQVA